MSVVVAIKKDNAVYFAADSQITRGDKKYVSRLKSNFKIWSPFKGLVIGCTGSVREKNIAKASDIVKEIDVIKKEINYDYIINTFIPKLLEVNESNHNVFEYEKTRYLKNSYLVGFIDKLYLITQDCAVAEIDEYMAIGSGAKEAMGAIKGNKEEDLKQVLIQAIKDSSDMNVYVEAPIIIGDTTSEEFQVIEDGT